MLRRAEDVEGGGFDGFVVHADVERVESIGAIGAVLEQVFLGLRELLARLVLAEAIPTGQHTGRLDGDEQGFVIIDIEVGSKSLLSRESGIDKQVLLVVPHGVTKVH